MAEEKSSHNNPVVERIVQETKEMQSNPSDDSMSFPLEEGDVNQVEPPCPRFQRTDQWKPVYSWLESLETKEVVTPDQIVVWLSENPHVKEQLYSRHSRHHLKHYIQRCHLKMLRRRDKSRKAQKGTQLMQPPISRTPMKADNGVKTVALRPSKFSSHSLKDGDISVAKKNEASLRYELLTDLQSQLTIILSRQKQANDLKVSGSTSLRQRPEENASYQLSNAADEDANVRITSGGASHPQDTDGFSVGGQSNLGSPLDLNSGDTERGTQA